MNADPFSVKVEEIVPYLREAAIKGEIETVKSMYERFPQLSADTSSGHSVFGATLSAAAGAGKVKLMKLMIGKGREMEAMNRFVFLDAVEAAAKSNQIEAIDLLLSEWPADSELLQSVFIKVVSAKCVEGTARLLSVMQASQSRWNPFDITARLCKGDESALDDFGRGRGWTPSAEARATFRKACDIRSGKL